MPVEKPVLTGKRLIEDALPIAADQRASRNGRRSATPPRIPRKLHLWWARRPLAAARAAVYATLVPAEGRGRTPAEEAAFFDSLCRWGGPESAIRQAREEVLQANGGVAAQGASTCSPAAGRSRSKLPGSAARPQRSSSTPSRI